MNKGKTYAERYNVSTDENGVLQNVRLPLLTVSECEEIVRQIQGQCYIKTNGEATISITGIRMIADKIKELGK